MDLSAFYALARLRRKTPFDLRRQGFLTERLLAAQGSKRGEQKVKLSAIEILWNAWWPWSWMRLASDLRTPCFVSGEPRSKSVG